MGIQVRTGQSVTFVTSSLRLSGGVLVVVELANGLARRGARVACVTSGGGASEQVQARLSPQVQVVAAQTSLEAAAGTAGKLRLAWQLARQVPSSDVVIATHTPTVVPALVAVRALRRSRRAVWFHQDYAEMFEQRPIEGWLLRHAPPWFERVITVSEACREEIERVAGVTAWVVPQGATLAELPAERPGPPAGAEVVLYVGDRRPRKGWDDLMAAAQMLYARHPRLRLIIVTKEPGPPDTPVPCELHVHPSWGELVRLYSTCHVFVSASWWEGFGRPPLEAMACGAPVVTTDSRGVREYAKDDVNCLMVPIQDPPALARAVDRILREPSLARRLAHAGLQTAAQFTWERAVERFAQALEVAP